MLAKLWLMPYVQRKTTGSVNHLFMHCRYTIRLWGLTKQWLEIYSLDVQDWPTLSFTIGGIV
jgi:hypothetical protein